MELILINDDGTEIAVKDVKFEWATHAVEAGETYIALSKRPDSNYRIVDYRIVDAS